MSPVHREKFFCDVPYARGGEGPLCGLVWGILCSLPTHIQDALLPVPPCIHRDGSWPICWQQQWKESDRLL